jgi:hypothetical protein
VCMIGYHDWSPDCKQDISDRIRNRVTEGADIASACFSQCVQRRRAGLCTTYACKDHQRVHLGRSQCRLRDRTEYRIVATSPTTSIEPDVPSPRGTPLILSVSKFRVATEDQRLLFRPQPAQARNC